MSQKPVVEADTVDGTDCADATATDGRNDVAMAVVKEEEEEAAVKATPLPFKQMAALSLVLLSEAICSSMLLPFVGLFVTHLQGYSDPNQAGRTSGVLVGVFMLGQVVSSKLWGYVSDMYGRRFPMIVGLFAGGWTMLFFGLAPNVVVCCILRFVHGFFNGNVLVAKTMIADITDKTNEAKGFALVSIMFGLGSCVGPIIGGFFYDPANNPKLQWMHVNENGFLGRNPAFLPSLVIFVYTMASLVMTIFELKETNMHRRPLSSAKAVQFLARHVPCLSRFRRSGDDTDSSTGGSGGARATDVVVDATSQDKARARGRSSKSAPANGGSNAGGVNDDVRSVFSATDSTFAAAEGRSNPTVAVDGETGEMKVVSSKPAPRAKISYMQAMRIEPIRNISIFYVLLSASDMTYNEILPLWAVAAKSVGGLDYFSDRVALIMLVCSVPSVVANIYFHSMCGLLKNNYIFFWMISTALYTASVLVIPQGNKFGRNSGLVFIMSFGIIRQVGMSWAYSLIHMLTAKSAPAGCVGAVYGISQSCASMTRCIIPFIVAPAFSFSISRPRPFPFNYYMTFLFASICSFAGFVLSFFVRITRNAEDDAIDAQIAKEAAEAAAVLLSSTTAVTIVGSSVVGTDSDEDADDAGLQGAYFSLVASFCTNPIQDAYIPLAELERANEEGRAERAAAAQAGGDAESDSSLESGGYEGAVASPTSRRVGGDGAGEKTYMIRARTADLLQSLRSQQVESRRLAGAVGRPTTNATPPHNEAESSMEEELPDFHATPASTGADASRE